MTATTTTTSIEPYHCETCGRRIEDPTTAFFVWYAHHGSVSTPTHPGMSFPSGGTIPTPQDTRLALKTTAELGWHDCGFTRDGGFDTAEVISFLDQVFGDVSSGLISLTAITHAGLTWSKSFQWIRHPDSGAAARAAQWDAQGPQGIFFRCTMLRPQRVRSGRGTERDSHALSFLWADLDYGTVGHKPPKSGLPLPPDEEAARKIIGGMPPPTLIIHSGGGLYPIWQFENPVYITDDNRAEIKSRSETWQKIIEANAAELKWRYDPSVGNLDRLLRLPGSINRKADQERPCRVIEFSGETVTW
jgi:hypothetical protein